MMDRAHFMRNLWRWSAGMPEQEPESFGIDALRRSEWSPTFEQLMRNRLVLGAFRYGKLNAEFKSQWDRMPSIERRAAEYQRTGNLELLVDIANLCLLEYVEGRHPLRHFEAMDTEEFRVQVKT